jgi:hypothetical protein
MTNDQCPECGAYYDEQLPRNHVCFKPGWLERVFAENRKRMAELPKWLRR